MSRGGNIRRDWTHRRLGLGASKPREVQLANTDALLTAVGSRDSARFDGDPLADALLDFAYDVDLDYGVGELDAVPIPAELLRLTPAAPSPRRVTWRVLAPAMGTALAAVIVAATVLISRGQVVVSPAATATVESRQLLRHADLLIADASTASPRQRDRLVSEARADLTHVSHLLPLTLAQQRPEIRHQLDTLEQRVAASPAGRAARQSAPAAAPRPNLGDRGAGGNGGTGGTGGGGTGNGGTGNGGTVIRQPVPGTGTGTGTGTVVTPEPTHPSPAPTAGAQPPPRRSAPATPVGQQSQPAAPPTGAPPTGQPGTGQPGTGQPRTGQPRQQPTRQPPAEGSGPASSDHDAPPPNPHPSSK